MAGVAFIQGDEGKVLDVSVTIDITGATVRQLKMRKPSGTTAAWTASIQQASPGILRYTTTTDDLDEAGQYVGHAYIEDASGYPQTGARFEFVVLALYEGP
jgi:hypothetical protein